MNKATFKNNLLAQFCNGAESLQVKDGFYILNYDIPCKMSEHESFKVDNEFGIAESKIFTAVQNFIINMKIAFVCASIDAPDYLQEIFANNFDFCEEFSIDVVNYF